MPQTPPPDYKFLFIVLPATRAMPERKLPFTIGFLVMPNPRALPPSGGLRMNISPFSGDLLAVAAEGRTVSLILEGPAPGNTVQRVMFFGTQITSLTASGSGAQAIFRYQQFRLF